MDICLSLAMASAVLLRVPAPITLSWEHSVEHFRIEERWGADASGLVLEETAVGGLGAGVAVSDDARWINGRWRMRPALAPQAELQLANSSFGSGYRLCWRGGCAELADVAGADRAVTHAPMLVTSETP